MRNRSSVVIRTLVVLLLPLLSAAEAAPPGPDGFVRIEKLQTELAKRHQILKQAEEFEKKPMPEKLLISWARGDKSFGTVRKLTGEAVVKAIFEWDELLGDAPSEAAASVSKLLPEILKTRYAEATKLDSTFKKDRAKVGYELCDQLVKPPLHVRELAIECLRMTYNGGSRGYVAEDSKSKRSKRQKEWRDFVKRRAK